MKTSVEIEIPVKVTCVECHRANKNVRADLERVGPGVYMVTFYCKRCRPSEGKGQR